MDTSSAGLVGHAPMDVAAIIGRTRVEARPYQARIAGKVVNGFLGYAPRRRNPHQADAAGLDAWERTGPLRSQLIESPTGSGKTVLALLIAKALQRRHAECGLDLQVAWVSMRRNLLAQAAAENADPGPGSPNGKSINARISFVSMFDKELPPVFLSVPPAQRLIIVDEAQHDATDSMAHLHASARAGYILGMSATPFRLDRVKLCFDRVVKDAGLGALVRDGYLAQYHHYTIPNWDVDTVVSAYLREPDKWGKSIMYFHRIEQCCEAAIKLRAAGVAAEVVTAGSDREEQTALFCSGNVQVLVNCMVLTEGFDAPNLRTAFCRPSCKGVTIQMAGRAFRPHPEIAHKNVVQCEHTRWPFVKTASPLEAYAWKSDSTHGTDTNGSGRWVALKANQKIDDINQRALVAIVQLNVQLPKFLVDKTFSKRGRSRRNRI